MKQSHLLATLLCAFLYTAATPAWADKGGHGNGHKHKSKHHKNDDHRTVIIHDNDRVIIREYIAEDYRHHCPPGLAKKGCMPPGQAKKRYAIGRPLEVRWVAVPRPLLTRLEPAPVGYRYVMVDRDVLLISEASHHVIDAITLLSAVGN